MFCIFLGYINLATALDLTRYLGKELDIVVWNAVLKHMRKPLNLFASTGSNLANLKVRRRIHNMINL